jgi:hypothetical protein
MTKAQAHTAWETDNPKRSVKLTFISFAYKKFALELFTRIFSEILSPIYV